MDSPPKRITRARAAAKATDTGMKTARIMTAAARAKVAPPPPSAATSGTKSTAAKRKTRADETDDDDDGAKRHRARPRKNTLTNTATASRQSTEPPKKRLTTDPAKPTISALAARARARRAAAEQTTAADKPTSTSTKRTTRTTKPAVPTTRTAAARNATTTTKKAVKFDEPDKENIEPSHHLKENESASIRAKPARRAQPKEAKSKAATAKASDDGQKKPLSPRKVTQMPVVRDGNDEDCCLDKPRSSPIRPPSSHGILKRAESALSERDSDSTITVNAAILQPHDFSIGFDSPPRRPPSSPLKDLMKSPAKKIGAIPFPASALRKPTREGDRESKDTISLKSSLLQTPAKRPQSPIKGISFTSTQKQQPSQDGFKASMFQSPAKRAMPGLKPLAEHTKPVSDALCQTPAMKTLTVDRRKPSEKLIAEDEELSDSEEPSDEPIDAPKFSGRLSCVLSRSADPVVNEPMDFFDEDDDELDLVQTHESDEQIDQIANDSDPILDTEESTENNVAEEHSSPTPSPPITPPQSRDPMLELRDKDQDPCHDMSMISDMYGNTPDATGHTMATPAPNARRETMGLSALAEQLGAWDPESPSKPSKNRRSMSQQAEKTEVEESPARPTYFEDEIGLRSEPNQPSSEIQEPELNDMAVTVEDLELSREAENMSHLPEIRVSNISSHKSFDDGLSEASQEYADENDIPVDPSLAAEQTLVPVTPTRPAPRVAITTTKVPLKPADNSTPSPEKKRLFSASKIPSNGTGSLPKSATVISYSPTKEKSDMWSTMGTPNRSPRKEPNSSLLRGAVVFVDVHTSEGADASGIFVDLLHQMGAKCVKSWNWNPSGSQGSESSNNRVGITHVVFKDGGKRTMERVRQAKGVVQCVGVSWVLDCEHHNEWLEEQPYAIDSSFVPRGGARRRRSMEPKQLANMNGTGSSTPAKSSRESVGGSTKTPYNRRQSSIWVHTPSDQGDTAQDGDDEDDVEWSKFILTPVPKTPAPETVAKYAAEIPVTPGFDSEDTEDLSSQMEALTRTCPQKTLPFRQSSNSTLSPETDEQVRWRLMAARRKSLQFAPKIGSPLSRTWQ